METETFELFIVKITLEIWFWPSCWGRLVVAACQSLSFDSRLPAAESLPQHILPQGFFSPKGIEVLTPRGSSVLNTCKGAYHRRQRRHSTQTPNLALSTLSCSSTALIDHVSYGGCSVIFSRRADKNIVCSSSVQTGCEEKKPPTCLSKCWFYVVTVCVVGKRFWCFTGVFES